MNKKISGVYCICNIINNKKYIGSSKNIKHRIGDHFSQLRNNIHHNTHLQHAWNKYGKDCFEWIVIERTSSNKNVLFEFEQKWMDYYKSYDTNLGYNILTFAYNLQ